MKDRSGGRGEEVKERRQGREGRREYGGSGRVREVGKERGIGEEAGREGRTGVGEGLEAAAAAVLSVPVTLTCSRCVDGAALARVTFQRRAIWIRAGVPTTHPPARGHQPTLALVESFVHLLMHLRRIQCKFIYLRRDITYVCR